VSLPSRSGLGAPLAQDGDRLGVGTLVDGDGAVIAPLDEIGVERAWQAGSSSKALVVRHRGGRIVVARGNPFGDSVDAFEQALRAITR
jgi:hypothetical protein